MQSKAARRWEQHVKSRVGRLPGWIGSVRAADSSPRRSVLLYSRLDRCRHDP
jgi:hypothetical protein